MAINKNHEVGELNGVKCAIAEKNVLEERAGFLKKLLEYNGFTVMVIPSPESKITAGAVIKDEAREASEGQLPETFIVGVTDVTFNPVNAVFGRLLKTPDGHIVTLAYWRQEDNTSHDEIPYYEST